MSSFTVEHIFDLLWRGGGGILYCGPQEQKSGGGGGILSKAFEKNLATKF